MYEDLLANPVILLFLALLASGIIFLIGSSKQQKNDDKGKPYACGENVAAEKVPVSIHMFEFAAIFIVFDVIAIILIFSFGSSSALLPVLYVAIAALALYSLPIFRRRD